MRARYTKDRDPRTLRTGLVFFDLSEIDKVRKMLALAPEQLAKAEHYTCSDAYSRAPGMVSDATIQIYALRKSDVAQIKGKWSSKTGEYSTRGRNAGKGAVRVSMGANPDRISYFTLIFRGRKHAGWLTRANKSTSRAPKARVKYTDAHGKKRSKLKPYAVTVETYKGKPALIKPKNGNRVFVLLRNGKLLAAVAKRGERMPWVHGSTSVPQAIMNENVVAIWKPRLEEYMVQRFIHHSRRVLNGGKYKGVKNVDADIWHPGRALQKLQAANARSWARFNAKYRPPAGLVNGMFYRSPFA